jgi:nucleotide-binding universal stress UspA family protein
MSVDFGIFPPNFDDELRQAEQDYLATTARTMAPDVKVPTGTQLLDGSVGHAIRSYVEQIGATLVVVSTHGRTGLSRMWLGSTTDWLVRFLPVPVLAVRPTSETLAPTVAFDHILVALDGSERSETIIPEAVRLGRPHGARLTLLRVVPSVVRELAPYASPTFPPVRDEGRTQSLVERATRYLDGVAEAVRRESGLEVGTEVVVNDRAADAILARAHADGAGVIALSTRGRGASRLLVGSVADKVLRAFPGATLARGPVGVREPETDELAIDETAAAGALLRGA